MGSIGMSDQQLDQIKEMTHMMNLFRMTVLQDKNVELTPLGEAMVNSKPAVGIKVSTKGDKGHKDVNFYFDR
jgi:hypothetical protein